MNWLLIGGVILRLVVLVAADPFNPDPHADVIKYIAANRALPISNQPGLGQSFQPPLYYLLMAPLYAATQNFALIHFVSFVLSVVNLIIIRRLFSRPEVFPDPAWRPIAFAFACFLPEFVMFESFVSNDCLTFLLGTLIFATAVQYIARPSTLRLCIVAIMMGLGLLTKGTFLFTGPAVALLVARVELSQKPIGKAMTRVAGFCLIWAVLGCYRYAENTVHHGRPIVHNMDVQDVYVKSQTGTWKGAISLYDINVLELIRSPILRVSNTPSYPLLFYATLWYAHVPESSFQGNVRGYQWVGSTLYAMAIAPTFIFLIGCAGGIVATSRAMLPRAGIEPRQLIILLAALLLGSNFAVVMAAGIKYDAYSCFQSRLCFQSIVPGLIFFGLGTGAFKGPKWMPKLARALCWLTIAACLLYFVAEIALTYGLLPSGPELGPG